MEIFLESAKLTLSPCPVLFIPHPKGLLGGGSVAHPFLTGVASLPTPFGGGVGTGRGKGDKGVPAMQS
jgi:hypothetical protein